jgi:hypothetical protein
MPGAPNSWRPELTVTREFTAISRQNDDWQPIISGSAGCTKRYEYAADLNATMT